MRVINGASPAPPPHDQERLIAMRVSEAQSQRALQATTWDGYETKALSLMAVPLAGVAALVAVRPGHAVLGGAQLLAEIEDAIEKNEGVLRRKRMLLVVGFVAVTAAAMASGIVLSVIR